MLALHWPSGPWPLDARLRTLVPSDAGRHRHWSLGRSSFSARDGARNPLDQPPIIQQPIRRIVQTTIKGSSIKFRSPRLSILIAALDDLPDRDADIAAILADLRRSAPTPVEQGAGRRHTGRRWGGLGNADACQRADGQFGLCPRQRSNICCSLSHLGSFALHQLVHILARLINVPAQGGGWLGAFLRGHQSW